MTTDFFDREAHAQKQTRRLLWLFGLVVAAFVLFTYLILALVFMLVLKPVGQNGLFHFFDEFPLSPVHAAWAHPRILLERLWDLKLFCWSTGVTLVLIGGGCWYKLRRLAGGGSAVAELLGGRKLEPGTSDPAEQRLSNVVAEMAVAAGLPVPDIYVLDGERGINAFAAGHTHDDVALGVTFGCLKLLTRDELQGVVAHEFSHVLNGDTRLNMKLMGLAHGLFWPTMVGRVLVRGTSQSLGPDDSIFNPDADPVILPTAPVGYVFLLLGSVSSPFVRLLKSLICRERDSLADAAAVQFTRNPAGIEGALKKVGGLLKAGRLDTPYAETASHLYFVNSSFDPWFGFQATHPPLVERIRAMDPAFDGQFPHLRSLPAPAAENSREIAADRLYEENLRRARIEAAEREKLE